MSRLETPEKELSPEEKIAETERLISVEIEKSIIEKCAPLLMLKNPQLTLEGARSKWIEENAVDFRKFFDLKRSEILELYHSDDGLDKAAHYIEHALERSDI